VKRLRWGAVAVAAAALAWVRFGPLPGRLLDIEPHVSTLVVDRAGEPLYEALSEQGGRSRAFTADALPETLVEATLAAEDQRFFLHPGVDPLAVARAALHNLRAGRPVEGGSTLTQQVVKLLTHRGRSLRGKAREALLSLRLEQRLAKREILALYLNLAPYGNQYVGAEAASHGYFGVAAAQLTPAQAALLAALPQRPSALDPYRHVGRAQARQRWVLGRMRGLGFLDAAGYEQALRERLRFRREPRSLVAPHFVERALEAAGPEAARRIETTLDAALQRQVSGIVAMHRARLERHGAWNVAVAVLDNARAEWLAWEGSGDYFDAAHGGAIDGVVAPRQPGSALKPFTYALAFETGMTPATVLPDLPSHFPTAEPGVLYAPRNYDGVFRGPLRARLALAGSENVPAVWTLAQVGVPELLRLLRRAGLTTLDRTPDYYGYALTMGDAEVRLDELVAAYALFARGGLLHHPQLVRRVVREDGSEWRPRGDPGTRVVSERTAFWVADVLSDARARAYAFGTGGSLAFPFPVAVKTGTSQAYRDNWTLAFTRDVTVGVWVGNFDRRELRDSSGVTGAAPLLHDVLLAAQRRVSGRLPRPEAQTLPEPPDDLVAVTLCALSGLRATDACPALHTERLRRGALPVACTWHARVDGRSVVQWPARYRAWAAERGLLVADANRTEAGQPAPTGSSGGTRASPAAPLEILNPPAGATYLKDPNLRDAFQTLPLRAAAAGSGRRVTWLVDGHELGTQPAEQALDWPLAVGAHVVAAVDDRGHRAEAAIRVR
jgi:penicillin-binding protein 1C